MYRNPSARGWVSNYRVDPAVLELHRKLSKEVNVAKIFFKDESKRFGLPAFKILGASWACYRAITAALSLPPTASFDHVRTALDGQTIILHAATEGNFGRAVAHMAALLGVTAKIHVPEITVEETRQLIAGEGAKVCVAHGGYDVAVRQAERDAAEEGGILVQDDAWPGCEEIPQMIVDGYSTMMLEIDRQIERATEKTTDIAVVPVGFGAGSHRTLQAGAFSLCVNRGT